MAARNHFVPPPFHERRPGLIAPVRIDPSGDAGPTAGQSRGPYWRRTSHGLYVPASVDQDNVEQRILEAAAVLPAVTGLTGWAALRWMGGVWFDGLDLGGRTLLPVDLATNSRDIRNQAGYVVHEEGLGPSELIVWDGLACTTAVRSLFFLMRYARGIREATRAFDLAAFSDLVSIEESAAYQLAHPAWTGVPQTRVALPLAEENSWSGWETWTRLVWQLDAGFPKPLCNRPIFDRAGNHIATPDLLDVKAGVAGEYNGSLHLERAQNSRDVARENKVRNFGLEPFTIVASDIPHPERAVQRMADARRRAKWEPESTRRWTIDLPRWWTPTHTVALRRQLTATQRARLLRGRAS